MNKQGYEVSYVSTLSLVAGSRTRSERDEPNHYIQDLQNQAHCFAMVFSGIGSQTFDEVYENFMKKRGFTKTWEKKKLIF